MIASTIGRSSGGNFIVALDANTGTEAWRFNTIPRENEPGGNTWNGVPYERRNGGSVWTPGSYDPASNLLYFGIAQTYDTGPYRNLAPGQNNDLLYTDSTIAINPDTGKLAWYFQHLSNDQWDYDWAFTRMLIKTRPTAGRWSALAASRRSSTLSTRHGQYAFSFDLGVQNVVTGIDPDRREEDRPEPDSRRRRADHDMPARGRREKLAAGLLKSRHSGPVRVAGRSVHGSAPGRARWARQPVDRRPLGAAATAGQRRQVRLSTPSTSRRRRHCG